MLEIISINLRGLIKVAEMKNNYYPHTFASAGIVMAHNGAEIEAAK